jgi:CPA1 family monovalent cation:H+ antiporter
MHARVEAEAIWRTLDFVLNGLVFVLIGLQLPNILASIDNLRLLTLVIDTAILMFVLIGLRLVWVFSESWISHGVRSMFKRSGARPDAKEMLIVGWGGMRGMITLAAAMSLPEVLDNGSAFPQRNVLVFLTFSVILVTLIAQGLSLPFLIRKLGLVTVGSRT